MFPAKTFREMRHVSGEDDSSGFRPRHVSRDVRLDVSLMTI
jgi:hypothetical protein